MMSNTETSVINGAITRLDKCFTSIHSSRLSPELKKRLQEQAILFAHFLSELEAGSAPLSSSGALDEVVEFCELLETEVQQAR